MLLPSLLNAQVRIDAGIACCACEVLVLSVGNVLSVLGKVLFGQSEVYYVKFVAALAPAHQKIVRLYVSMQKVPGVYVLNPEIQKIPCEHLVHQHQNGLETEFPVAQVEKVFQTAAEVLHGQDIEVPLGRAEVDLRDALVEDLVVLQQVFI